MGAVAGRLGSWWRLAVWLCFCCRSSFEKSSQFVVDVASLEDEVDASLEQPGAPTSQRTSRVVTCPGGVIAARACCVCGGSALHQAICAVVGQFPRLGILAH